MLDKCCGTQCVALRREAERKQMAGLREKGIANCGKVNYVDWGQENRETPAVSGGLEVLSRYFRASLAQKKPIMGIAELTQKASILHSLPDFDSLFNIPSKQSLVFTPWCWGIYSFWNNPLWPNLLAWTFFLFVNCHLSSYNFCPFSPNSLD